MTVSEYRSNKNRSLRAHKHDWPKISEPNGYAHLNAQFKECESWEVWLTANECGRVHGILVDEVFYVVWLDHSHALLPRSRLRTSERETGLNGLDLIKRL